MPRTAFGHFGNSQLRYLEIATPALFISFRSATPAKNIHSRCYYDPWKKSRTKGSIKADGRTDNGRTEEGAASRRREKSDGSRLSVGERDERKGIELDVTFTGVRVRALETKIPLLARHL